MKLTEQQKNNIEKLDAEMKVDLLYTCMESLAVLDRLQYCEIMGIKDRSRQSYYDKIRIGEIRTIKMPDGRLYPFINDC